MTSHNLCSRYVLHYFCVTTWFTAWCGKSVKFYSSASEVMALYIMFLLIIIFFSPVIKDPGIQNKKKLITNYYYLSEGNRISLHAAKEQPRAGMIINLLRKRYHELTYLLTYLSKYQCSLASRHGGETAGLWICWLYKGPSIWWWMNQWLKAQDYVDQI